MSREPQRLLIVTCEHGGARIPARYRPLFRGAARILRSHRGYDRGALALARHLACRLRAPLYAATVSRLLVDLNRSPSHPRCLSEFVLPLPRGARAEIITAYHAPHRARVRAAIAAAIAAGDPVLHVAVHSFAPVLDGVVRRADIGLLYDPGRTGERALCNTWAAVIRAEGLGVRRNYPYRGRSDGLTTWLRREFTPAGYLGVELEVNQALLRSRRTWAHTRAVLADTLRILVRPARQPDG